MLFNEEQFAPTLPIHVISRREHAYLLEARHDALAQMEENAGAHFIKGMSLYELQNYMLSLGCEWAMNFDGGGSSTMVYEGEIVNTPFGDEDEAEGEHQVRRVSDALIIR